MARYVLDFAALVLPEHFLNKKQLKVYKKQQISLYWHKQKSDK